jgi:hypothetical protein
MSHRPGCGPLGCLLRGLLWLAGTAVAVALLALLVVAGIWYSGPRPAPASLERFCASRSIGFAQVNLDPSRPASRELLQVIDDSIVRPRLERAIGRSPGFLRPAIRAGSAIARHLLVPRALPYSVGASFYRGPSPRDARVVTAVNSRIPLRIVDLLGITGRLPRLPAGTVSPLSVAGRSYPIVRTGRQLMTRHDNWLLLSYSSRDLATALQGAAGGFAAPEEFHHLARDANRREAAAVFVNRGEELYELLNTSELALIRASRPADREIVARLFARVLPLTGSVLTATAEIEFPNLDSGRTAMLVTLKSADAAAQFASVLQGLKPFLATVLARSNLTLDYRVSVNGSLLELTGTFTGLRIPLTRLLTQHLR